MTPLFLLYLSAMGISKAHNEHKHHYHHHPQVQNSDVEIFYEFPHFWTGTGFCPSGNPDNQQEIIDFLLSPELQLNLRYVAALPHGAITHVRIHWLLSLIEFVQFSQAGNPIYDFTHLDEFLYDLDDLDLMPVIEFMGNPGEVFVKNPNRNDEYWEDFAYQVARHYLNLMGASKLLRWRFESWNEPDLPVYNKLNFSMAEYVSYVHALRRGLNAAGRRPDNSLYFPLRGPAGLFKIESKHPLCWGILKECNGNPRECPFDVLTYHRKGHGQVGQLMNTSSLLLKNFRQKFPALQGLAIANDEADPISGWSTPRDFQSDVRYAAQVVTIVLEHWRARLEQEEFHHLESISHDNAFLSYHPYEFSQRTLLAHFRMNDTQPRYSQFIQKPVYAALGMLAKLGSQASDVETVTLWDNATEIRLLRTKNDGPMSYLSWILLPRDYTGNETLENISLPLDVSILKSSIEEQNFAFIVELLAAGLTDPASVWQSYGSPPYPNALIRSEMRRNQTPILHSMGVVPVHHHHHSHQRLHISLGDLTPPWIALCRVCSNLMPPPKPPLQLTASGICHNEVLMTWREAVNAAVCLRSYEVWFRSNETEEWSSISSSWHLPFPSFHYAPVRGSVNGFYKVRGVDIFNRSSQFSDVVEYMDIL